MTLLPAEANFKKGLAAIADLRPGEAAEFFRDAMQIEKLHQVRRPDMRYLSYYGLALAQSRPALNEALLACEWAVSQAPGNPILILNLGRVHALAGRTALAFECFEYGLQLAPAHRALLREILRTERRARPLIPGLPRSSAINRLGGRVRAWLIDPALRAQGRREPLHPGP